MITKTTKQILNEFGEWEEIKFVVVHTEDLAKRNQISSWCTKKYEEKKFTTWWATFSTVAMEEKIYTHWSLENE